MSQQGDMKWDLDVSTSEDFLTPVSSSHLSDQLPDFSPQNQHPPKERELASEKERERE